MYLKVMAILLQGTRIITGVLLQVPGTGNNIEMLIALWANCYIVI